jgi:hypothetical protein
MPDDDMKTELERLRRENDALKKGASEGTRMKVSDKGGLSVYGMGRFPVTLYKEQWLKLLNMSDEIRAFIAENEARLKAKDYARLKAGAWTRLPRNNQLSSDKQFRNHSLRLSNPLTISKIARCIVARVNKKRGLLYEWEC